MSKPGEKVTISPEGWDRINKSYQAILDATKNGISVYGVSVNFGDLKHQKVVTGDVEKEPNRSASIKFNEFKLPVSNHGLITVW